MRLLVCGGRSFDNQKAINKALRTIHEETPIALLIHGGASGADQLAGMWANNHGLPVARMDAPWKVLGRKAGPVRNGWMLALLLPDAVLAFAGGAGTQNMKAQAQAAGVRIIDAS
tara:strand:+ start:65 stop:409 length:345 start_codon:yes stop_codon:yes gene_type:complete